jgi:hypothetical protein
MCVTARFPEMAAGYVKAGLPVDAVRTRLFDKLVQATGGEIDNKEPPAQEPKADINPSEIYAARKGKAKPKQSKGDK